MASLLNFDKVGKVGFSVYLLLAIPIVSNCSGGGGGSGGGSSSYTGPSTIVRSFAAPSGSTYTATVNAPSSSGKVIYASAIGAQSGYSYFSSNISSAISAGAYALVFPTSTYYISPPSTTHISISGAHDLIIDGQGSTLIFQGASQTTAVQGFVFSGSTRVVLKNFIIDYDVRIASQGTLGSESAHCSGVTHQYVAVNTGTYPMTDARISQAKIFNDSNSNLWGSRANEYYTYTSPVALTGGNAYYPCSSSFDSAFPVGAVGHSVTIRHFAYDGNTIGVYGCQDLIFQNITLYASPAMGFYFANGFRGAALENIQIIKNAGDSTRLITLAADGVHFNQASGDLIIENSEISYQGDDGLNIVTPTTNGTTVSGNQLTISNSDASTFNVGSAVQNNDTFVFYSPSFTSSTTATYSSYTQSASTVLTFASLSGVSSGYWLMDQSQQTSRVYLSGNNFHDNRGRGLIARSKGLSIYNNQFTNNSGPAILLATDGLNFNEGAFATDVSVVSNTITGVNQTQTWSNANHLEYGAISLGVECPTGAGCTNTLSPATNLLNNILIQNNTITNSSSPSAGIGILISNTTNISVQGNTVTDSTSAVQQSAFGGAASAAGSIHSTRSSSVSIGTNTLSRAATSN